mmetsp:Transcript_27435/g.48887  ORF Transcript_27435/g.48887 Transcript_27435/m.48887 type:complete len:202 (+) Transcript_27435:724-1329(+)
MCCGLPRKGYEGGTDAAGVAKLWASVRHDDRCVCSTMEATCGWVRLCCGREQVDDHTVCRKRSCCAPTGAAPHGAHRRGLLLRLHHTHARHVRLRSQKTRPRGHRAGRPRASSTLQEGRHHCGVLPHEQLSHGHHPFPPSPPAPEDDSEWTPRVRQHRRPLPLWPHAQPRMGELPEQHPPFPPAAAAHERYRARFLVHNGQ